MRARGKRLLAIVISLVTAFSTVPTVAFAATGYEAENLVESEDGTLLKVNLGPYTLINRQEAHADEQDALDQAAWIDGDAALTYENLTSIVNNLSKDWAPVAGAILSNSGKAVIDSREDKAKWDEWFGPNVKNGDQPKSGSVDVIDALMGRSKKNTKDANDPGTDRYNMNVDWHKGDNTYMTTGLQMANSLDDVLRQMCFMSVKAERRDGDEYSTPHADDIEAIYKKATETTDDGVVPPLAWMKDNEDIGTNTSTKAYYRLVTSAVDNEDRDFTNTYGLIFYGFQLAPITADGITVPTIDYTSSDNGDGEAFSTYFENRSQVDSDATVELGSTTTESVSNSFSKSTTITHGVDVGFEQKNQWALNVGFKWEVELTIHGSYNWSRAVNSEHSSSEELSRELSSSSTSSVTLPAQTAIALEQRTGTTSQSVTYKCPVALNFNVAVVSLSCKPKSDIDYVKSFSARFGSGSAEGGTYATQNLYMRAVNASTKNKYEMPYGNVKGLDGDNNIVVNGINWDSVANTYNTEYATRNKLQRAATLIPLFAEGATMTVDTKSKIIELGGIQPLYRLNRIKLEEGDSDYSLTVGDSLDLGNLKVQGYNDYNVEYFGFDPDSGTWVLSDAAGNELDSSDVATLNYDPTTGSIGVTATNAGTVYLKWVLNDGVSYKAKESSEVTRANPPQKTAMVRVVVTEPPFDATGYKVTATGEANTLVNEPVALNNAFKAGLRNQRNVIVSRAVTWEAEDQYEGTPVTIDEAGNFVATMPGEYNVRALYNLNGTELWSDWLAVRVDPTPEVTNATVEPSEFDANGGSATVTLAGNYLREGAEVTLTDAKGAQMVASTTGNSTRQTATFELPANTVFDEDAVYSVAYTTVGMDEPAQAGTVTVKANTLQKVEAANATCTEDGNIEYWACNETGKLYANASGTQELTNDDVVLKATGHALRHVDAAAYCEQEGNSEYWICDTCGGIFANAEASQQITLEDTVVAPTGHAWGDWTKDETTGTETRVCANDPAHVETRADENGPMLKSHSLTLSGTIGVNNFMDLSALTDEERTSSYMEFIVGEGSKQVSHKADFDPNFTDTGKQGFYGFTCPTSSIQMADPIKATFHYGDKTLDLGTYSVKRYIEQFEAVESGRSTKEVALVHSIADYGHYAQPFLSTENKWTIGTDYANMDKFFTQSYDISAIRSSVASNKAEKDLEDTRVLSSSLRLHLESGTAVEALLTPREGQSFSDDDVNAISATFVDGKEPVVSLRDDGRISVRVSNVSAHQLGTPLVVTCDGKTILSASALSYVNAVLDENSGVSSDAKNAMSSLYAYQKAASGYR